MMKKLRIKEFALPCSALVVFFVVTCYKMTNAPLWFDEAIEYWYSKIMFGPLPFGNTSNMYDRIISTYQPPLYNILMYFWLKISDSEAWFVFSGVLLGFFAMIALYKSIKLCTQSVIWSSSAIIFSTFVYQLVYYWQECSEYCLLLCALFWTIYYWIKLIKEHNCKNIINFTIGAVISVYSQYGAIFIVFALAAVAYCCIVKERNKKSIREISIAYLSALIFAAIPLFVFFMSKQIGKQQGSNALVNMKLSDGVISDMYSYFQDVLKWCFTSYLDNAFSTVVTILLLVLSLSALLYGGRISKLLVGVNTLTWFTFYFAVKLNVYSYGEVGNRYNLFFIPLWIVSVFVFLHDIYLRFLEKKALLRVISTVLVCVLIAHCYSSWDMKLQKNWRKQDNREIVQTWYDLKGYEENTIVYYGASAAVSYYIQQNEAYSEAVEERVVYMPWYRNRSDAEYMEYIRNLYGEELPDTIYIAASHWRDDLDVFLKQFDTLNYTKEDIYNNTRGKLFKLSR